ncbi:MAG: hypothetical protein KatS3mg125_0486 [Lysobacterales bacterium]|jgi:hypothetical protein|nr:MAG: hypothetical protein KatS3mg125_0486 [Xanthomonadales bacterium]
MQPGVSLRFRLILALYLGGLMSLLMSGVITFLNLGLVPDFLSRWLRAWLPAWAVASPVAFLVWDPSPSAWRGRPRR